MNQSKGPPEVCESFNDILIGGPVLFHRPGFRCAESSTYGKTEDLDLKEPQGSSPASVEQTGL